MVAFSLARSGVKLTKSHKGRFARVLSIVQEVAGFQQSDVYRDVRRVLEDPVVGPALKDVYRRSTQSGSEKSNSVVPARF
jgi:hypothetical protein